MHKFGINALPTAKHTLRSVQSNSASDQPKHLSLVERFSMWNVITRLAKWTHSVCLSAFLTVMELRWNLNLLVCVLECAVFVADDGHHIMFGALGSLQGHCPQVRGQSSLGHHCHQALLHLQPEDTHRDFLCKTTRVCWQLVIQSVIQDSILRPWQYSSSDIILCLPYDNKLSTEVGSQIHRHPDWPSY